MLRRNIEPFHGKIKGSGADRRAIASGFRREFEDGRIVGAPALGLAQHVGVLRGPSHSSPRGTSSSHLRTMTIVSPSRAVTSRARWKLSASEVITLRESIRTDQSPRRNS